MVINSIVRLYYTHYNDPEGLDDHPQIEAAYIDPGNPPWNFHYKMEVYDLGT